LTENQELQSKDGRKTVVELDSADIGFGNTEIREKRYVDGANFHIAGGDNLQGRSQSRDRRGPFKNENVAGNVR
jgi:hypothetical protein